MIASSVVRGLVRMLNFVHGHPQPGRREKASVARIVKSLENVGDTMWKHRSRLPYSFQYYRDVIDEEDPVVSLVLLFTHREPIPRRSNDVCLYSMLVSM